MKLSDKILKEITESMEAGLKCFVHKTTHEIIAIPDENRFQEIDFKDEDNGWKDEMDKVYGNPDYIEIENMESSNRFRVMEDFTLSLPEGAAKIRLITALEGHKPFANFNFQVHNFGIEKEQWFRFRTERMIEWIKNQI